MKPLRATDDIIPIGELKAQASRVFRRLREDGRPVVITQHGRPAGVLLSTADYDRLVERERFVQAVEDGLRDSASGRLVDDERLAADLDAALGGPAER